MESDSLTNNATRQADVDVISERDYLQESYLLNHLPVAVYVCDPSGTIRKYNEKAIELWGRKPSRGETHEKFCEAFKLYLPDGKNITYDQTPIAGCLKDAIPRKNIELIIERPDSSRLTLMVTVTPIFNDDNILAGVMTCFSDITEKKNTEDALERKRRELQDYVDNAAIGLHWVDKNGIIKWANKAELQMLGYDAEEYVGKHISEFHANDEKIKDILGRLQRDETLKQYEAILKCKDGSIRTVQISSNVMRDKEDRFIHSRCFTIDITAQKELFASLCDSEYRYRQLIDNLPVAIYTTDENGYLTSYNEAAVKLWGREPVLGKELWCGSYKIYKPDGTSLPLSSCPMAVAIREQRAIYGEEIIIEMPNGDKRYVLPHPAPTYNSSGVFTGGVNMMMDITELKQAELAIRESEERFRTAANAAPVMIWMSDVTGWRYFFNRGWLEYTGSTIEKTVGNGWIESVHPDDLATVLHIYTSNFKSRTEYKMEYRLRRGDNKYRWMLSNGIPRYTEDGTFEGYIGTIVDIHEQKLVKEELERNVEERTKDLVVANAELELSNNRLEQFAYVASHDLQEPLRKIMAFGDILMNKYKQKLNSDGVNLVERMQAASVRMKKLIDDLLNYSKMAGIGEKETVNMAAELEDVLLDLDNSIREHDAAIHIEELKPVVGNATQVRQLFQNLLGNALKFSGAGKRPEINITSRIVLGKETTFKLPRENMDQQFQLIEVKDNGIGFEQQYAERIFQFFQRLHGRDEYIGSGVGLSIVQKVMENHNGYVRALGNPGNGAVFQLLFPYYE